MSLRADRSPADDVQPAVQAPGDVRDRELAAVLAGVWGGDPLPGEGPPAGVRSGGVLRGVKTFCSGAGGLHRALVLARTEAGGPPVSVWVRRAGDVRVVTSTQLGGRAARGLAVDLAVSAWLERRRYAAEAFTLDGLAARPRTRTITVIIPTRECAETIGGVLEHTVGPARDAGLVQEVVVVDAGSRDGTAERAESWGARVLQQDALLTEHGPAHGKGDAMWRALSATGGDIVCFLDGDTLDPDPRHLQGLIGPLLLDPDLMLVKAAFRRPFRSGEVELADEGGRVTELMARPLINLHHPRLAGFAQPLAGEFAARRGLLESLPFPVGYGVEIATLIDALHRCGLDALAETAVGERRNRHQSLRALGMMAYAVLAAVERRLEPRSPVGGHLLQPWRDGRTALVPVEERPPLVALATGARAAAG